MKDFANQFLRESLNPEQGKDPKMRALAKRTADRSERSIDRTLSKMYSGMQEDIEKTAAARIEGMDLERRRPLIGHLRTGQVNAVSMRVPGRSGAYLVLFASKLSKAVAWAIPHGPADTNGMMTFPMSVRAVTERIEADPEVADRFADIVVTYAVTGSLNQAGHHLMPPGYFNLASMLTNSLEYFVLGHEYAHVLLGHLDTTAASKGVLSATEAEALAYSWQQELDADGLGMILSINTCIEHGVGDISDGFSGVGLFFDALDVMDRAVALLQTGDENARQLGSHPPSDLRKRRLRDLLPQLGGGGARERPEGLDGACAGRPPGADHPPAVGTHPADPAGKAPVWRAGGPHVADHPEGDQRRAGSCAAERTGAVAGPPPRLALGLLPLMSSTWQARSPRACAGGCGDDPSHLRQCDKSAASPGSSAAYQRAAGSHRRTQE